MGEIVVAEKKKIKDKIIYLECPYCGSAILTDNDPELVFGCFTLIIAGTKYRSSRCYENQIAQLMEQLNSKRRATK